MIALAGVLICLAGAAEPRPQLDFDTEIIPVLTKSGCNSGACHGAAAGRGGLHLSLWGTDPAADHEHLVHEFEGRRVNTFFPERSLVLRKPTGEVDHGGGVRLDLDSPGGQRLLEWIRQGARRQPGPRLIRLDLNPVSLVTAMRSPFQLRATAAFDDGSTRDVTPWTVFQVTDPSALEIDARGLANSLRPGQHVILARFLHQVTAVTVITPYQSRPASASTADSQIDAEIAQRLDLLGLVPGESADDATFLRRVTLDLTGRLPVPEDTLEFLGDSDPDRRVKWVDRLLASPTFAEFWTLRFSKWLRLHSLPNDSEGLRVYGAWLRANLNSDEGLHTLARALLTAEGDSHTVGPANFARMVPDARTQAELAGRFFLGVRLECANCHNHPLDRWTQDDYHGLAAIFARLDRGRIVRVLERGAVTNPKTGDPAVPRIPGVRDLPETADPRVAFADWLTDEGRPQFARAMINRIWGSLLGRAFVEPYDDLSETNPATHPQLLSHLTDWWIAHDLRLRDLIRAIVLSEVYGRASDPGRSVPRFFAQAHWRPLESEVLLDAIADVTGIPEPLEAASSRAIEILDPLTVSRSLDLLGRCPLSQDCAEITQRQGLATHLHLMNGELLNSRITSAHGQLSLQMEAGMTDADLVREFYIRALCRLPTEAESRAWAQRLSGPVESRRARLEDFVWSLLYCDEFTHNH